MATNPMQRKARNAFLLGMLLTLLITGVVIAILFIQLTNAKKQQNTETASKVNIYTLSKDVKSGEKLTMADFITISIDQSSISEDAPFSLYDLFGEEEEIIAKFDMKMNTIVTPSMVTTESNQITDDVRTMEYNMISLQTNIEAGDYIDIRLMMPNGQDFIVVSKKQVEIPVIDYAYSDDTIWMNLTEGEILTMSNAIVEAYKISGSRLYATPYVEPGTQGASTPTYVINSEVAALIDSDPNIVNEAKTELRNRIISNAGLRNNYINTELNNQSQNAQSNLENGMSESMTTTQEDRKTYLETLVPTY